MTHRRSWSTALVLLALMLVSAFAAARTLAVEDSAALEKISPWVLDHTSNAQQAEFLVVLADQADLSSAAKLPTKLAKGRYVYDTLWDTARRTQRPILDWLAARGVEHRSYYIANVIWVKADRATALALAARPDVALLEGNPRIRSLPEPSTGLAPNAPDSPHAVELGITYTKAPQVWAMGYTGQGIVVGGQDTGIHWDHPALKNHYRGWNGSTASHDYNWHDSIHTNEHGTNPCGINSPVPCDDNGHGTHTIGTAIGDDGGSNQIGMAPGARFIGCRNMDNGYGTPATYLECFEFFLAPYPVGGTPAQGIPELAPDVTNNSWGCPPSEGCAVNSLLLAVQAQRAAGIMTVVSAGNSGPSCSTTSDPPSYHDEVYTVGNINASTGIIASSSSRGPATIDGSGRLKPDITAPGTAVRSAYPPNTYAALSGTSMAAPHVAGAVALLWSARPALKNNLDLTEQILNQAAVHVNNSTCDPAGTTWPNNTYGYGRLDILAAVNSVPAGNSYLIGTVTSAADASPIVGAAVSAYAAVTQTGSTTTITDGSYSLLLMANTYTVTASAYGYQSAQITGVTIVSNTTTTLPITLTPLVNYVVSGTVSDAVTGLPRGGVITIGGYLGAPVSVDSASGFYSVTLAAGNVYTFQVASTGYLSASRVIGPLISDRTENFALDVDLNACTAPGYLYYGLSQSFDAATPPTGWTVVNNVGSVGWSFNNPGNRTNSTGGTGNFAIADSDNAGSGVSMNTELRTPVIDLSTQAQVTLTFKTDFRYWSSGQPEVADVDVSINGAAGPWTNIWRQTADYRGPRTEQINLSAIAGGQPQVMLRFHYYNAVYEGWWQVDDVQIGQCVRRGLALNTDSTARSGLVGEVVTYTLRLTNTGDLSDTFLAASSGHLWPVQIVPTTMLLAAGTGQWLTASVSIPATATAGLTDSLRVTVSGTGTSGFVDFTTTAVVPELNVYLPLLLRQP